MIVTWIVVVTVDHTKLLMAFPCKFCVRMYMIISIKILNRVYSHYVL